MNSIADNIAAVRQRIQIAKKIAGRDSDEVLLLAISKTKSAELIRQAYASGLRHFGENYPQEAKRKMQSLSDLDLIWHFTGPIQSNKTRLVADGFHWVHSLDRTKIAERLSAQRPTEQAPLNLCIQVNISQEASKNGVKPEEIPGLAEAIAGLPRLTLRGLMCIPDGSLPVAQLHESFAHMRSLVEQLKKTHPTVDTLSMGMSGDMEIAIAEGATVVRIGTAIFGAREATHRH